MIYNDKPIKEIYVDGELVYSSETAEGQLHELLQDIEEIKNHLTNLYKNHLNESQKIMDELSWSIESRINNISTFLKNESKDK